MTKNSKLEVWNQERLRKWWQTEQVPPGVPDPQIAPNNTKYYNDAIKRNGCKFRAEYCGFWLMKSSKIMWS